MVILFYTTLLNTKKEDKAINKKGLNSKKVWVNKSLIIV